MIWAFSGENLGGKRGDARQKGQHRRRLSSDDDIVAEEARLVQLDITMVALEPVVTIATVVRVRTYI